MACTRRTKTLVSTCVILSGMTNIVCLLYVGWVTNYIANIYIKVPMPLPERKLEGDKRGDTLRIMERLDRLENVVNQHIHGKTCYFNTVLDELILLFYIVSELFALNHVKVSFLSHKGVWHLKVRCAWGNG